MEPPCDASAPSGCNHPVNHFHQPPSKKQLITAVRQVLHDNGVTQQAIFEEMNKRIGEVLDRKIADLISSGRLDKLLLDAVTKYTQSEVRSYDGTGFSYENRLAHLIQEELKRTILQQYKVVVEKRT